jgi:hypothetical protein
MTKLTIDLDDFDYDDQSIAAAIQDAVRGEIQRYIKSIAKDVLKEEEARLRALVKKAAGRDWQKVAAALEALAETPAK